MLNRGHTQKVPTKLPVRAPTKAHGLTYYVTWPQNAITTHADGLATPLLPDSPARKSLDFDLSSNEISEQGFRTPLSASRDPSPGLLEKDRQWAGSIPVEATTNGSGQRGGRCSLSNSELIAADPGAPTILR